MSANENAVYIRSRGRRDVESVAVDRGDIRAIETGWIEGGQQSIAVGRCKKQRVACTVAQRESRSNAPLVLPIDLKLSLVDQCAEVDVSLPKIREAPQEVRPFLDERSV